MHVAIVVYSHYSRDARVRRYAEYLAKQGNRVDVVALHEDYLPKDSTLNVIKFPLPRKRLGKLWYFIEYFLFFLYASFILSYRTIKHKYKVIHINNMPDFLVFSAVIPKLFGSKVILDMHDPMPELYMSKYHAGESHIIVKLLKAIEYYSLQFADYVITANPEFRKIFLIRDNISGNKLSVILNCPDDDIFQPSARKNGTASFFTLLYMGTIDRRFGLDIAVDAIPDLIRQMPNLRFIIIPKIEEEGEYFDKLRESIHIRNLSKYIKVLQPQPLEKIAQQVQKADIGVVLAKNGVFTDSIFPVKLLEFIQMNVPVIATKTKILRKYFNNKAIYFLQENTSGQFGKAVSSLYRNPLQGHSLAANAKKYLKLHNWKTEKLKYKQLLGHLSVSV